MCSVDIMHSAVNCVRRSSCRLIIGSGLFYNVFMHHMIIPVSNNINHRLHFYYPHCMSSYCIHSKFKSICKQPLKLIFQLSIDS